MKPFDKYKNQNLEFWAFIKYISEKLGYSERGNDSVKFYSLDEIKNSCNENSIFYDETLVQNAFEYINDRAELLNSIKDLFMKAEEAEKEFEKLKKVYDANSFSCLLPMNKQKNEKRKPAFLTCMVNILTEQTLRELLGETGSLNFDCDPRNLTYVKDSKNRLIGASSRRFDGAYPATISPKIVWEIKEYYYATTFGSRIADGVYETQLDGFEFKQVFDEKGVKVHHILFIDSYHTWWKQGKSYLCRLVDALNIGLVDEVIIGKEVLQRWPELLSEIIQDTPN